MWLANCVVFISGGAPVDEGAMRCVAVGVRRERKVGVERVVKPFR